MADLSFAPINSAIKRCSGCGADKPPTEYYAGRRTHCKACMIAAAAVRQKHHPITPAKKAEYARNAGKTSATYVPAALRRASAAERRSAEAQIKADRAASLRDAYAAWDSWLASALQAWLLRYRAAVVAKKDAANAIARARYRVADREHMRMTWRKAKHDKRARKAGQSDGSLSREGFASLYKQAGTCSYCRVSLTTFVKPNWKLTDATLDHIIPLWRGGMHATYNIAVVCSGCNFSKARTLATMWARTLPPLIASRVLLMHHAALAAHLQALRDRVPPPTIASRDTARLGAWPATTSKRCPHPNVRSAPPSFSA